MSTKRRQQTPTQKPPDDPEYVRQWAKDLVAAIGKRQGRLILEDYRGLAKDPKVSKHGREIAAQRARILAKLCN